MHPEVATPAFVLHARAYGESDRIVTFLTATHGKLTGIAKGAKNSRRRFGGTLEPFVHVRVVFQPRPATDLVFLARCELLRAYPAFRSDLDLYAAGSYLLELADKMVLGREPDGAPYGLLREALEALADGAPPDPILRAFELHLLAVSGYAPALDVCRGCGAPAEAATSVFLCVERGGLFCRSCVRSGDRVRPVAAATAAALGRLAAEPIAAATAIPPSILAEAAIVSAQLIDAVTPSPLRSREFLHRTRVASASSVR